MYRQTSQPVAHEAQPEAAQAAPELSSTPRLSGGDFSTPDQAPTLPYNMFITDWEAKEPHYKKGVGDVQTTIVSFSDKSKFVLHTTTSSEQQSPVLVDITPPLMTHVRGFNTRLAEMMAGSGVSSRIIGTNQARGFSLLHDAEAALLIMQEDDTQRAEEAGFNANESFKAGYSKGIMEGLGELVIAGGVGRDIKATLGLDPCIAQKINYAQELKQAPAVAMYLTREGIEVASMIGGELVHLRPDKAAKKVQQGIVTFLPTPKHLINQKDKWDTLASGETGTFPSLIPMESVVVLHFFGGSRYGHSGIFEDKFKDHPYFRSIHEGGFHLTGGKDTVLEKVVAKTSEALRLIEEGVGKDDLADALSGPILKAA